MQTFITHVNDTLIAITYTFKCTNLSIHKIPKINCLLHQTSSLIHPVLSFHFNIFYVSTLADAFHCHETTRTNANRIPNQIRQVERKIGSKITPRNWIIVSELSIRLTRHKRAVRCFALDFDGLDFLRIFQQSIFINIEIVSWN